MATDARPRTSTRERILDVALDLFVEEGFSGATVTEVERRAGLAPGSGSFYRHFPSKAAVLQAAVEREMQRNRAATEATRSRVQQVQDPIERCRRIYEQMLHDLRRFDRLFRLMLAEGERIPELREAIWAAVRHPVTGPPTEEQAVETVAMAALGGYHLFSIMQGRPFNGVDEEQFLSALASFNRPRPERNSSPIND